MSKEIFALGLLPADEVSKITSEGLLDAIEAHFRSLSSKERLEYGRRLFHATEVSIPNPVNLPGQPNQTSNNPPTAYFVPGPASLDLNLRFDTSSKGFHVGEVSVSGNQFLLFQGDEFPDWCDNRALPPRANWSRCHLARDDLLRGYGSGGPRGRRNR